MKHAVLPSPVHSRAGLMGPGRPIGGLMSAMLRLSGIADPPVRLAPAWQSFACLGPGSALAAIQKCARVLQSGHLSWLLKQNRSTHLQETAISLSVISSKFPICYWRLFLMFCRYCDFLNARDVTIIGPASSSPSIQ